MKLPDSPEVRTLQKLRAQVTKLIVAQRAAERARSQGTGTFARKVKAREKEWKATAELADAVLVKGYRPVKPEEAGGSA